MDALSIEREIKNESMGKPVVYYEVTGSTNSDARELFMKGAVHGTLIVAGRQESGRGRSGKSWVNQGEDAIAMSLLLRPSFDRELAASLTLLAGYAAVLALEELTECAMQLKWPNDIVADGKKICGILTELYTDGADYAVVVGMGINVLTKEFPEEIRDMAGSVLLASGKALRREVLIGHIMEHFSALYQRYAVEGSLAFMQGDYNAHLAGKDAQVRVLDPGGAYTAISRGIDAQGQLLVEREDGTRTCVYAGEVSVRGLYGYV